MGTFVLAAYRLPPASVLLLNSYCTEIRNFLCIFPIPTPIKMYFFRPLLLLCGLFYLPFSTAQEGFNTRDSIGLLCDQIAADSIVESAYVGVAGMPSEQWKRYEQLMKLADDTAFLDLTDHLSPAVRLYAYYGLTNRNPDLLIEALRNHPDDTSFVHMLNGCIFSTEPVRDAAISWAHDVWVRGNPSGLSKADKLYLHDEYLAIMAKRRGQSGQRKKSR